MNMEIRRVLVVGVLVLGGAFNAGGDEISELKEQLLLLQKRIEKLENEHKSGEAVMTEKKTTNLSSKPQAMPESLELVENVKISGDFRYRHEYTDDEAASSARSRDLYRVRLGFDAKINENTDFNFRLVSGSDKPYGTNQTLDGGFSSKDIWIDRAALNYHGFDRFNIIAGKMANPFYSVGKSQLIWDVDVSPEGGALKYAAEIDNSSSVFANFGGMWVEEDDSDVDQGMFGGQVGIETKYGYGKLTAGMSYFDYGNVEDEPAVYNSINGFGNTTVPNGSEQSYLYDYNLLEAFAAYDFNVGQKTMCVYGDYVKNIASNVQEDTGWLVGCTFGKAKLAGSWDMGYNYRDIESDAVLGVFTESDFLGGGTNSKGHKFAFNYALEKNFITGLTYAVGEKGDQQNNYDRVQLDFKLKF
jgi:uncharacterized protein YxjI